MQRLQRSICLTLASIITLLWVAPDDVIAQQGQRARAGRGPQRRQTAAFEVIPKKVDFEGKTWVADLAKEVAVVDYKGKRALHVLGGEQTYVYLADSTFQDGVIEVDMAGPIFTGIGFRGREKGRRVEKVYFRPQNAGTAKHANTVQYAVIGREDGTWRHLRTNFPGKYETGADIKKDEWFHVRMVIRGTEVKVYVNDTPEPILTVDKMLDGVSRGTVGVWGHNSYFANFRYTPAAQGSVSQDWPQWRGPNRDGKVSASGAPQTWPSELTQTWKVAVGSGDSTPALVGDRLYVYARQGSEQVMMCLKTTDGKEVWKDTHAAPEVGGAARRHPGPRSSPAVADGKVVVIGVGGVVSCYGAPRGDVLWRKNPFPNAVPRFFTSASPIIVGKMAVAHVGGQGNGAIIAYDLSNGDEIWRRAGEAPEYASPVLMTVGGSKQIVTLSEKGVIGLAVSDGKLLWSVPFAPARMSINASTPIVDGQTVIYTAANRGCHAVKIERSAAGFAVKPLWSNPDMGSKFSTPILKNGLLFGLSDKGKLFCISAATGKSVWTDETARDRMGFAPIVDAGSAILALPSSADLVAFKPDGAKFSQISSYKVSDIQCYAHPVMSGKRIFIKDQESLALWMLQ